MSRTSSFLLRLLGFLILVGLLAGGGVMLFRAGQMQGYRTAQYFSAPVEAAPGAAPLVPPAPSYRPEGGYYYPHTFHRPIFGGFFGLIFGVLLFLFALRLLFGPRHWGYPNMAGPNPGWHAHPHFCGPPPWMQGQPHAESGGTGEKTPAAPPADES